MPADRLDGFLGSLGRCIIHGGSFQSAGLSRHRPSRSGRTPQSGRSGTPGGWLPGMPRGSPGLCHGTSLCRGCAASYPSIAGNSQRQPTTFVAWSDEDQGPARRPPGDSHNYWAYRWAQAYVDFAAGEKRLVAASRMGLRLFPVVGWAERGGTWPTGTAIRCRASTSPGAPGPRCSHRSSAASGRPPAGLVGFRFRHRVDELTVTGGTVNGVRGAVLEPSRRARGRALTATRPGSSSCTRRR